MPTRHKYLFIVSLDQKQIKEIKKMFIGKFVVCEASVDDVLNLIRESVDNIAGVIIDDTVKTENIISLFKICQEKNIFERVPMFLTYEERGSEVYNQGIQFGIDELIQKPYINDLFKKRILHIIGSLNYKFRLEWLVDTQTKELKESIQVLEDMKIQVLEALATLVEFRNLESGEHIYRVRFITDIIMRKLLKKYPQYKLTDEIIYITDLASILHDLGKIMISDEILNKPSRLTEQEFEEIKLHTYYGNQILDKLKGLYTDSTYRYFRDVICYHHEKFDGKGYPEGLKGNDIPIWAQVVSLADVYDALTNERAYKKAFTHKKAMKLILDGECGQFNPDIVDCFLLEQDKIIEKTKEIKEAGTNNVKSFTDKDSNTILNDYEKEKAFHRAYQELVSEYYFEFDKEFGTVEYFNALGKKKKEKYNPKKINDMSEKQQNELLAAVAATSPDSPVVQMMINITEQGVTNEYQLTIRTTWDMYTKKCLGGVGKIVKIK